MPKIVKQLTRAKKKSVSIVDRIAPVKLSTNGIKMNLYGKSGSGKTTLACSFPKKLLLVGTEDGTRSVHNVKGVDFVRIKESGELTELTEYVVGAGYNTVVLDTASGLQDLILKEILGIEKLPAQRSWGMAKQQEWGQCALETKERLRSLLDLPINVVIIAQEREFNTENDTADLLMPFVASALSPSVVGWLNPACDYIGQTFIRRKSVYKTVKIGKKVKQVKTETKQVEYCLRTAPDPVFTTKFRLPKGAKLPEVLVDPDYTMIDSLIRQGG